MNIQSDLDINRAVRRVFVKHWIDLGRLSVRTTRGNVFLFGQLQRIEGRAEPLLPPIIDAMMYEIKRSPGVRQLRTHFDNWINDGGRWRPHERTNIRAAGDAGSKVNGPTGATGNGGSVSL